MNLEQTTAETQENSQNYRMLDDNTLVTKEELGKFINGGLCFKLNSVDGQNSGEQLDNWICEDDLETFWEKNCLLVRPHINTCIGKLSKAKKDQDLAVLASVLDESKN